ncbi:acyl-CoA thioesterase [Portibacter marinus]|uniref:acyl-CoA thioesterase n=1 Tax=Portibacter marinus TaxID=2898660 RepID=UPI001F303F7C|nr:thioesterase family protein [Portibacter marinus]
MYTHTTQVRVRYAETDQMGYVYYGNYARYYEIGRVEAMRNLGLNYAELESKHNILMPVLSMETRFIRPARYDDMLTLETTIAKLPLEKIVFRTEIYDESRKILNSGIVRLFFLERSDSRRIDTPEIIIEKLKPYFES